MSYTVMSDEMLKVSDSKIYYEITKIWNDRKRAEINAMHKEVIKTPIFKNITKDHLQDRVDRLLKNGTLLNKPNRDKDSLRLNIDKINDPSINITSLSICSITHFISTIYTNTNSMNFASNTAIQPKFTITQETAIFFS